MMDDQDVYDRTEWVLSSGTALPEIAVPIYVPDSSHLEPTAKIEKPKKPSAQVKQEAFDLYQDAWNNAIALLSDARVLLRSGRFARAFALAATALEEIGKSQHAADVSTGVAPQTDFGKLVRNHRFKSAYATRWVEFTPLLRPFLKDEVIANELFERRSDALYASFGKTPSDEDFEVDASTMIAYCEGWLDCIHNQELFAERIGTQAFTK